jgi:hypothetical protein
MDPRPHNIMTGWLPRRPNNRFCAFEMFTQQQLPLFFLPIG